jgi:hypothetical protein
MLTTVNGLNGISKPLLRRDAANKNAHTPSSIRWKCGFQMALYPIPATPLHKLCLLGSRMIADWAVVHIREARFFALSKRNRGSIRLNKSDNGSAEVTSQPIRGFAINQQNTATA